MCSVPEYGPRWVDGLVQIVGGEGRNLATYQQDEGTGGSADKLEGRHWVPEGGCEGQVEDKRVDVFANETREDG